MPTIIFHGPELERDKKRELISTFTETASRLTGMQKENKRTGNHLLTVQRILEHQAAQPAGLESVTSEI
jgi:hypothetical protein